MLRGNLTYDAANYSEGIFQTSDDEDLDKVEQDIRDIGALLKGDESK